MRKTLNASEQVTFQQVAARAIAEGRPIPLALRRGPLLPNAGKAACPDARYKSWEEFVAEVPDREVRRWCCSKARGANKSRFMSGIQEYRITTQVVYDLIVGAKGRCRYCNSLCVERMPLTNNKTLAPWGNIGRRIGSLGHMTALVNGGSNAIVNLCWSCMWCNTWPSERVWQAANHGGLY
jgi:hypothetical protein